MSICRDLKCYPDKGRLSDVFFRLNYITRKPIYDFLKENLSGNYGTVVDFGCGDMPYRSLVGNTENYIGLDVDEAQKYGFSSEGVLYYDGKDIPLDDESVDLVYSVQVFQHIKELDYSIAEINRILKNRGELCFTVPMCHPIHYDPYDFRRFTVYGIEEMLKERGFDDIEIKGSNRPIDTIRYMRSMRMRKPFRNIYCMYINILYVNSLKGEKRPIIVLENFIRRILGKNKKPDESLRFPIDYLVRCKKAK